MKKRGILLLAAALLAVLAACGKASSQPEVEPVQRTYTQISQEEAKRLMAREKDALIVDVRRQDEFEAGHIPGAVCIPNESITAQQPSELPDLDQLLLIYCRSGNRSKQAAQKLADLGYTRVYEFGGILDWTGEVVTEESRPEAPQPARLVLDSFDGGGPEYSVELADPELVTVDAARDYGSSAREEVDGAAYQMVFTFTGRKPGKTTMTLSARSPIADNYDAEYEVTVGEDLSVSLFRVSVRELDGAE